MAADHCCDAQVGKTRCLQTRQRIRRARLGNRRSHRATRPWNRHPVGRAMFDTFVCGPCLIRTPRRTHCTTISSEASTSKKRAAFFDVDGTITKSNVVIPYLLYRLDCLSACPVWRRVLYIIAFAVRTVIYLVVDSLSRSAFNALFYWSYKGKETTKTKAFLSSVVWEKYMSKNLFPGAVAKISELKTLGYIIVLVTGSLDIVVKPLADYLKADHVIASSLEEKTHNVVETGNVFTGKLREKPLAGKAKAERIHKIAKENNIDLEQSTAYGDSKADLEMLRCVGIANAVRPDTKLYHVAKAEGWNVYEWEEPVSKVSPLKLIKDALSFSD